MIEGVYRHGVALFFFFQNLLEQPAFDLLGTNIMLYRVLCVDRKCSTKEESFSQFLLADYIFSGGFYLMCLYVLR